MIQEVDWEKEPLLIETSFQKQVGLFFLLQSFLGSNILNNNSFGNKLVFVMDATLAIAKSNFFYLEFL